MSFLSSVEKKFKLKKPKRYGVVFHNNDVTPMDIVIFIIVNVFNFSKDVAYNKTMEIHNNGKSSVYSNSKELCLSYLETINFVKNKIGETNLVVTVEEV